MTQKFLVTSGCSFSECIISTWSKTWPAQLADYLPNYQHISKGMGSQGNGLISRSIIYQVTTLLKYHSPEDILVGIMWSGPDRHDFYLEQAPATIKNHDGWMENPTGFIENQKNWIILNHHWTVSYAKYYYSLFHDNIGAYIYSLEHILRVQWFLKLHRIKYFMTTYTNEVLPATLANISDTKHLYEQIDFEYFLPVEGEYEWCRDFSNLNFPTPGDNHPGSKQHKAFTEQVIIPFLQKKFNLLCK